MEADLPGGNATIGEALLRERYLNSGKGREELKWLLQQQQPENPS